MIDGKKVATGALTPHPRYSVLSSIDNSTTNRIVHTISGDCYVNCSLSVVEDDSSTKPINVFI